MGRCCCRCCCCCCCVWHDGEARTKRGRFCGACCPMTLRVRLHRRPTQTGRGMSSRKKGNRPLAFSVDVLAPPRFRQILANRYPLLSLWCAFLLPCFPPTRKKNLLHSPTKEGLRGSIAREKAQPFQKNSFFFAHGRDGLERHFAVVCRSRLETNRPQGRGMFLSAYLVAFPKQEERARGTTAKGAAVD